MDVPDLPLAVRRELHDVLNDAVDQHLSVSEPWSAKEEKRRVYVLSAVTPTWVHRVTVVTDDQGDVVDCHRHSLLRAAIREIEVKADSATVSAYTDGRADRATIDVDASVARALTAEPDSRANQS